jgi:hypothetical protein
MALNDAERKIMDGSVWTEFCDNLKQVGEIVMRPEIPADPYTRGTGYRFLAHLLRAGLESTIDYADPQFPAFFRLADETKKMLNDNPDNIYYNCVIDGRFDYRIRGKRGTPQWFGLGTKGSSSDVGRMLDTGNIDSTEMTFAPDGSFEILMSATKKPGNWLPMSPTSRMVIVRITFGKRDEEEATEFSIECLNPERKNNNLQVDTLGRSLQGAVGLMKNIAELTLNWTARYKTQHTNLLPADNQKLCQDAGGDPNIFYYQSYFDLAPDEALYVHLDDIPECATWNLQLSNYWMESLEYRFFKVCVNKFNAHYEPDGSVKIVIAHEDPGPKYPNWLNTLGEPRGGMLGRYVKSVNPPDKMKCRLVKLASLRDG